MGCRSHSAPRSEAATPAMTDDSFLPFSFPAIGRKKVTAAFDGGRLSSDGGVMLLAQAERRLDPAFKLACGRLPDTGVDLCSQPTVSRWENAPSLRDLVRLMGVMVDLYCASYSAPPVAVTLDIDDTLDVVHGHQQLSFFNAPYDER